MLVLQASAPGASKLAQQVLGPWTKAPKAARSDYEQYIKATAACLGGEPSTAEVQEASSAVWDALASAPQPEKLRQSRTSLAGALKPYRHAHRSTGQAVASCSTCMSSHCKADDAEHVLHHMCTQYVQSDHTIQRAEQALA